ncbi:MAG: ABC transporter permease, partial [Chloroflexi bacterium]|nr:ABC transporter permease [Chloroflexota bacterium]
MPKWLIIARMEYLKLVRRRAFLLATLGLPLLIIAVITFSIVSVQRGSGEQVPLAYVDEAGILPDKAELISPPEGQVRILRFSDQASAAEALAKGSIQAFYLFPPDYLRTRQLQLFYWQKAPSDDVKHQFNQFIREQLASQQPPAVRKRLVEGMNLVILSASGQKQTKVDAMIAFLMPFAIGMGFVFVVIGSAGYLLQAVSVEKENRMVEVLFTSTSPLQLIAGKTLGLLAVSLTQVAIWGSTVLLALLFSIHYFDFLQNAHMPWSALLVILLYFLPTYAIVAAIMVTISSVTSELQQAQQIAGFVNILFLLPFFFVAFLFVDPNSPLLIALTLFPTTAFTTVAMRWGVTVIPFWQLATSWLLVWITALAGVFIASRVLRTAMLRYG